MILDTSAVIAILSEETEAVPFAHAIETATIVRLSAATHVELTVVATAKRLLHRVDEFLAEGGVVLSPFDGAQAAIAREAYARFGSGPHGLNFGDCFAYALSRATGEPLLFKGRDFARTDVLSALSSS